MSIPNRIEVVNALEGQFKVEGHALSNSQRKRMERALAQPVQWGQLGYAVQRAVAPTVAMLVEGQKDTDMNLLALLELLVEKGIITEEEHDQKLQVVTRRLVTPNSPSAESAGPEAQRLDEPAETLVDEERASARLVEG